MCMEANLPSFLPDILKCVPVILCDKPAPVIRDALQYRRHFRAVQLLKGEEAFQKGELPLDVRNALRTKESYWKNLSVSQRNTFWHTTWQITSK